MDKPTKRDTSFCERDALADMRRAEREVLYAYAACASEGGSLRFRTMMAQNFAAAAEDLYELESIMQREARENSGVSSEQIKRAENEFSRRGSDLVKNN